MDYRVTPGFGPQPLVNGLKGLLGGLLSGEASPLKETTFGLPAGTFQVPKGLGEPVAASLGQSSLRREPRLPGKLYRGFGGHGTVTPEARDAGHFRIRTAGQLRPPGVPGTGRWPDAWPG